MCRERGSVLGNNAADGCRFCDYALTLFPPFRRMYFLVTQEEDVSSSHILRANLVRGVMVKH